MSDITISYKGNSIATMDATGSKTLLTEGKYCEDDITVAYTKPSGGGGETLPGMMDTSEVITIGANSITKASDAKTFFNSYNLENGFLYLVEAPTVNNQLCMVLINQTAKRWRSNSFTTNMAWGDSAYDCKLVEGTHYVLWSKS